MPETRLAHMLLVRRPLGIHVQDQAALEQLTVQLGTNTGRREELTTHIQRGLSTDKKEMMSFHWRVLLHARGRSNYFTQEVDRCAHFFLVRGFILAEGDRTIFKSEQRGGGGAVAQR